MNITILGAGKMGQSYGTFWARAVTGSSLGFATVTTRSTSKLLKPMPRSFVMPGQRAAFTARNTRNVKCRKVW
jgi:predicted dinucleotide-binding enzyme